MTNKLIKLATSEEVRRFGKISPDITPLVVREIIEREGFSAEGLEHSLVHFRHEDHGKTFYFSFICDKNNVIPGHSYGYELDQSLPILQKSVDIYQGPHFDRGPRFALIEPCEKQRVSDVLLEQGYQIEDLSTQR
jgi:hypothetical protein